MTRPPRSILGRIAETPPMIRRLALLAVTIIFLIFTFFPERYRSAATLAPSDPATFGLGGSLSQLGAASSVFGNQAAVEITMRVAGSLFVRNQVIDQLRLMDHKHFKGRIEAHRWLADNVGVRSLRGGLVLVETKQPDAAFAEELITTFARATRERLAVINRQQTSYKRQVLEQLVTESGDRLDKAQLAYDNFRRRTRYADPTYAFSAIGGRIPVLQAAIKAKEVQLTAARQFATEDNMTVRQIRAELQALNLQLAQQQALSPDQNNSVGRVVEQSTQSEKLERELMLAKSLYEGYHRYLLGTAVEDLTSVASLRVIEPPFIDTSRQINTMFLALAILTVLIGLTIEFYQLRPPLEARSA